MGSFQRSGKIQDRTKFLGGLRKKVGNLRQGTLQGMQEEWTTDAGKDVATLKGFGVTMKFTVDGTQWSCETEVPMWLPIPQAKVEHMIDKELDGLKGL